MLKEHMVSLHVAAQPQLAFLYMFCVFLRARQRPKKDTKHVLQLWVAAGDPPA